MTEQSPIALCGIGVSPGVAHGPIAWLGLPPSLPDSDVPEPDRAAAQARLKDAFGAVADFLEHRAASAPAAAADVLLAQSMMVADPTLHQRAADELDAGHSAAHAANAAFRYFSDQLRAAGGYLAERAADLADLRDRVLAHLLGAPMPGIPNPGHPIVLAAQDLAPADTAVLDPSAVLAIVTSRGGPTSHTAILAKSLGIPAIVGCGAVTGLDTDTMVLVDGTAATVRTDPTAEEVAGARARAADRAAAIAAASGPGMTSDGAAVSLLVNIGAARDLAAAAETDSEGVGLMRTEFLYLDRASAPTRAEQQAGYAEVFAAFAGRKVVVRTLDAGADKPLAFVEHGKEDNPALGVRGLRLARRDPGLLTEQLAALGAAAANSPALVWVMAPMVSTPAEAREFAALAHEHGLAVAGSMVEVPAAALRARDVLAQCDFLSIGTNDLSQYTFAADRMASELADLLDPWQPALLDLVKRTADAGIGANKPVGVCGEAASDPLLALVLVGLGVRSLSMAPPALGAVRAELATHSMADCEHLAARALAAEDGATAMAAVAALAAGV